LAALVRAQIAAQIVALEQIVALPAVKAEKPVLPPDLVRHQVA
jgi:hypothetical protein